MIRENTLKQLPKPSGISNSNIAKVAKKLAKTGPKYKKIDQRNTKKFKHSWELLIYEIRDQNLLTAKYNSSLAQEESQKYHLTSISENLEMECEVNNINYEMFMVFSDLWVLR
jgi:hypothetical protein